MTTMSTLAATPGLMALVLVVVVLYRLEKRMATNQQRLDAVKTQLSSIAAQTRKAHAEIVNKIEALRNQESNLDFSGLDETVEQLGIAAEALDAVVPDEIDAEDPGTPEVPAGPETPAEDDVAPSEDVVPSDDPPAPTLRTSSKRSK